jgi:Zn-dependent protease with chaperone function
MNFVQFFKRRLKQQATGFFFSAMSLLWLSAGILTGAFLAFFVAKNVPVIGTPLALLTALIGILAGVWLNQASLALSLPFLYSGKRVESGSLHDTFYRLAPQFDPRKIQLTLLKDSPVGATVFVAGFFPFTPKIFIEESLITSLTEEDWEPIFAHELSHIRLNHLYERCFFLIKTIFACLFFSTALLTGLHLIGLEKGIEFAAILSAFLPIILCQVGNSRLMENQEEEADLLASVVIPNGKQKLNKALQKITSLQGVRKFSPALENRLRKLAA